MADRYANLDGRQTLRRGALAVALMTGAAGGQVCSQPSCTTKRSRHGSSISRPRSSA